MHGDEMSEWRTVRIEDIAKKIAMGPFGSDIKTDNFVPFGIPVIRGINLSSGRFHPEGFVFLTEEKADKLANSNAFPGDIIFTHRGTLGQVGLIPDVPFKRYIVSQSQMKMTCDLQFADPRFIYYYFKSSVGQHALLLNTSQTGVPAISRPVTSLKSIELSLPPLPFQHAIAHILGSLDDKIELNRRMNETLEAMARALFKDWFVEFGPVRAKMEGRQPPGLSAEIAALFPDALDTEGKPVGWEMTSFAATINLIGGGTPRTAEPAYWGGEIPWFSVVDIPRDGDVFTIDTEKKITERGLSESATRLLSPGTSIISARGTVGKCALVGVPMAMNQSCYGVIGKEGRGSYFTHFSLRYLVTELQQNTHGSVFDTITQATFQTIHVPTIPIPLTQAFDHTVSSFLQRILTNLHESHTLAALRDLLLPKLLSGELRVRDAEGVIAGAR